MAPERPFGERFFELGRRLGAGSPAAQLLDVVGVGECSLDDVWLLDERFAWGQKAQAAEQLSIGGGQVATAMVACARLGLRAGYIGAIGDDSAGRAVKEGLVAENVACDLVEVPGGRTRTALLLVDRGRAERTVVERRDHGVQRPLAGLPFDWLTSTRVLHADATNLPLALAAVHKAKSSAVITLDVEEPTAHGGGLDALLRLADVIVTAEGFAEARSGISDRERAMAELAATTGAVVVTTLGAAGCAAWDGAYRELPGFVVPAVVDTTACGDTFRAGLIAALLAGAALPNALRQANGAAALKCRDFGRRGCPTRAELDALLADDTVSTNDHTTTATP